MSERPLPTVIGPTENALRSLLSHLLASTPINGYDEWVALNYTASGQTTVIPTVASALKIEINAAEQILERLTTRGLIADLALTPNGEAELLHARSAVAAATATLVEAIDEADQHTTRVVLDTIRERAELALTALDPE